MRSVGEISGVLSSDPAGMTATLRSGAMRGSGLPQLLQKTVRNRFAPGTGYPPSIDSPLVQLALSGLTIRLLAWPVPLA